PCRWSWYALDARVGEQERDEARVVVVGVTACRVLHPDGMGGAVDGRRHAVVVREAARDAEVLQVLAEREARPEAAGEHLAAHLLAHRVRRAGAAVDAVDEAPGIEPGPDPHRERLR